MLYFNSLSNLRKYLKTNNTCYTCNNFYAIYSVFFVGNTHNKNRKNLRIEKFQNNGIFGTTLFGTSTPIGSIDVEINKTNTSNINFYLVNDLRFANDRNSMYGDPMNNTDSEIIKQIIFEYVVDFSKINGKTIIRCDVHYNLKNYNADIKQFGFELTDERAKDNPYWFKTFKTI